MRNKRCELAPLSEDEKEQARSDGTPCKDDLHPNPNREVILLCPARGSGEVCGFGASTTLRVNLKPAVGWAFEQRPNGQRFGSICRDRF